MRIVVTPSDIVQAAIDKAAGHTLACCCPVAQSMKRRGYRSIVNADEIIWWDGYTRYVTPTPPVAAEWIEKYDNHHHVGPFSFELPGVQV